MSRYIFTMLLMVGLWRAPLVGADLPESYEPGIALPKEYRQPCSNFNFIKDGIDEQRLDNGNLYLSASCQDGKQQGVEKRYYKNGQVWQESNYENGMLHGAFREYHFDGALKIETYFRYGKVHGDHLQYYSNGNLQKSAHYDHDQKEGVEKTYQADGHLMFEENYHKGKKEGLSVGYYEDGKVACQQEYKEAQPQGPALFYDRQNQEAEGEPIVNFQQTCGSVMAPGEKDVDRPGDLESTVGFENENIKENQEEKKNPGYYSGP
ncbi:MAG: toxin-antitoxin system YwqK family antitoxin [Candidatus Omnitrophica bacterium]|nr:toxin-antitoxin system YwqK family antitoxin [Candidatus Omnitrophota bacterium]